MCFSKYGSKLNLHYCEAQARVRQGQALKGKGLKACLELTLKLVATTTHHHHPPISLIFLN